MSLTKPGSVPVRIAVDDDPQPIVMTRQMRRSVRAMLMQTWIPDEHEDAISRLLKALDKAERP